MGDRAGLSFHYKEDFNWLTVYMGERRRAYE